MDILQAICLGILEGVTEFLPISSTAHLLLAARLLNLEQTDFLKTFEIFIQLGAVSAVIILFFEKLLADASLVKKTILSFIPAGVAGFFLSGIVSQLLDNLWLVTGVLFIGGAVILLLERIFQQQKKLKTGLHQVYLTDALGIGVFQILSFIPGVSRAAATIFGGMTLGLDRKTAAEFSFLLSLPTILAASGWRLYQTQQFLSLSNLGLLAVGFGAAFITALLTIKFFLRFITTHNFNAFGVYRILLAVAFAIFLLNF